MWDGRLATQQCTLSITTNQLYQGRVQGRVLWWPGGVATGHGHQNISVHSGNYKNTVKDKKWINLSVVQLQLILDVSAST